MKLNFHSSLSAKLLLPFLLCGIMVSFFVVYVIYQTSEKASEKHVRDKATEYSESFLIATEVNSSVQSIIRTTNSLGTYEGITDIFIIKMSTGKLLLLTKTAIQVHRLMNFL